MLGDREAVVTEVKPFDLHDVTYYDLAQVSAGPAPMIAVLNEHPEWFKPLFAELDRRGLRYEPIRAAALRLDPGELGSRHFPPSAAPRAHPPHAGRDPVG